jgi:putative glycosyltransferase (TIGR04372 family)
MRKNRLKKPITRISYHSVIFNSIVGIWFVILIIVLRPFIIVYLAPLQSSRVGHFVLDTEILLARLSQMKKVKKRVLVLWIPESVIVNSCVFEVWQKKLRVLKFSRISSAILLTAVYFEKLTKFQITLRFEGWDGYLGYASLLEKHPPIFEMSDEDQNECETILHNLGFDTNKEWVCILARDDGYLKQMHPDYNWDFNSYRNSNIETYLEAAEFLAKEGLMVFRMGQSVEKRFKSSSSNLVIDYANSSWRSDKLDVYLSAKSKFFISSSTGLDAIAYALRKPIVTVNLAQPLSAIYTKPNHLFILKKFMHENSFISIRQYYDFGSKKHGFTVDNPRHLRSQDLEKLKIKVIDNSSEEILSATKEMYFLLQSKNNFTSMNANQTEFWRNFPEDVLRISGKPLSRIGASYIEKNSWLLANQ